jgi:hypothetical protein
VEKMKITYIKTKGFRKFEDEFETNLYDVTTITGGNTKGKTNILYAIVWAFLGTNITGDDKVFLGNKNVSDCYLKLKFIDNLGEEHTLERYKNRFTNENNFIMLDNKKVDQKEISKFYGEKKLWLSIINPNYFINKSPAEQKELIDKYLPNLDVSIVYDKLDEKEKMYLEGVPNNMVQYLKEINSNRTMYENKIELLRGKIAYAENIVNTPIEEIQVFEKEEELSLARQELSFLSTDENAIHKEKQQKIVDGLEQQIKQQQEQIEQLSNKMTTGKKVYLSIKSEDVAHCPMCEQVIQNENRMITIKNMKVELEKYFEERTKLEQELLNNKSKFTTERCKLHALEGDSSVEKEKQIAIVLEQINRLEQEQLEIETYNKAILLKQQNINNAHKDIDTFKKQIKEYDRCIDNVKETKKIAQKLFINYIEEKMKFATKHLKNVSIKYYTILKESGEIKEDFIITYNNNELKNLSRSETIATSLELCNMFNKISEINIPLFIDDSESCADYNFIQDYSKDTQILIARVEKGQELKIQDYNSEVSEYLQAA